MKQYVYIPDDIQKEYEEAKKKLASSDPSSAEQVELETQVARYAYVQKALSHITEVAEGADPYELDREIGTEVMKEIKQERQKQREQEELADYEIC
jgi:hypothetical protein